MFTRKLQKEIESYLFDGKIIMILGPRQVGKTTLAELLLASTPDVDVLRWNGDNAHDRDILSEGRIERLSGRIGNAKYIFIDEAQKVENIWNTLKQLVDTYKKTKQIIITGSSSFHILDQTSEPLTGRKVTFTLFPISAREYIGNHTPDLIYKNLEEFLIFGMYPDILTIVERAKKERYLIELTNSNLYKDILEFQEIKSSAAIHKLLKILALRVWSEISYSGIGSLLSMDWRTIERYVDLLEKSYIIFRLPAFFTNKEKELSKMQKIYFYDLGVRNALLGNFQELDVRDDVGKLWENFFIIERMKKCTYDSLRVSQHFWRSYDQQEVDLVEEGSNSLTAYECKWNEKKSPKPPALWTKMYPESTFYSVHRKNIMDFL